MEFENATQHSLANLAALEKAMRGAIPPRKALYLATQLISHGHPRAPELISMLRGYSSHRDVCAYVDMLERCYRNVRRHYQLENLPESQRQGFYKRDGFIFVEKRSASPKLLVIFATMFNNFHFSHAAMVAMLGKLDCSLLILKDSTLFNYHKGVARFADSLPEIGPAITRLAQRHGIEQIYITGFSSCGYAALYTSLNSLCHGYLGFSQPTDMRAESPLDPPLYFTPDVRDAVDQTYLIDLKEPLRAAGSAVPRTFVYGERNECDSMHALHIADLPGLEVIALPDTSHSTVEYLNQDDRLVELFVRLTAG